MPHFALPPPPFIADSSTEATFQFTDLERELFERRYENKYDLVHDVRYNNWKSIVHGGM